MAEQDKAEKLAAAKKRVEQMKKKKGIGKRDTESEVIIKESLSEEPMPTSIESSLTLSNQDMSSEETKPSVLDQTIQNTTSNELKQDLIQAPVSKEKTSLIQESSDFNASAAVNDSLSTSNSPLLDNKAEEGPQPNIEILGHIERSNSFEGLKSSQHEDQSSSIKPIPSVEIINSISDITTEPVLVPLSKIPIETGVKHISENAHTTNEQGILKSEKESIVTIPYTQHCAKVEALEREIANAETRCDALQTRLTIVDNDNHNLRLEIERLRSAHIQNTSVEGSNQSEKAERSKTTKIGESENFDFSKSNCSEHAVSTHDEEISSVNTLTGKFIEVDLGSQRSPRPNVTHHTTGGLGFLISNSLNAITGANSNPEEHELLEDEFMDFDEKAYELAQEQEAKKRLERVKNLKRALRDWEGWRLDIVETRSKVRDGHGPIFEI